MSSTEEPLRGRIPTEPVKWIEPVDGWSLWSHTERDGDGFDFQTYIARKDGQEVILPVSRFRFTPSQDRFVWLVRNGFPSRQGRILGPWDDTDLEMAMAIPVLA